MLINVIKKAKKKKTLKRSTRNQNLSKEKKDKRWKKAWGRYKSLPEKEKQNKVEYMRNYYLAHKKQFLGL